MSMSVKKIFLFLGVFVFFASFAEKKIVSRTKHSHASLLQTNILQANKLYKQNKYTEALEAYSVINKNKNTPMLFYNMGNCAYKIGDYVQAIIYWSKAKKGALLSQLGDIEHNIALAYDKLGASQNITFWSKTKDFVAIFSLLTLQILFLFLWFLCFVLFYISKKVGGIKIRIILWVNIFLSFIFGVALFVKHKAINYPDAIVKTESVLFAGPNTQYHHMGKLSVADKVTVQKSYKKWYKVNSEGVVGWMLSENIEVI